MQVNGSTLYNLVQCPQRVALDAFGDPASRDEANPFVRLLWERGTVHEHKVIEGLDMHFVDLSGLGAEEQEAQTLEAMRRGELLIYGGRIAADDLLGIPDLLRKEPGGYVPGDIKSGAGEEGGGQRSFARRSNPIGRRHAQFPAEIGGRAPSKIRKADQRLVRHLAHLTSGF
jgi:hypothetical protein